MRIGINTLFLIPGEVGGSQTYFCETLRAMIDQFPDDEFTLFTQRENDGFLKETFGEPGRIQYVRLDFAAMNRFVRILREQTELPWRVKKAGVDVLWSPGYTAPILCTVPPGGFDSRYAIPAFPGRLVMAGAVDDRRTAASGGVAHQIDPDHI